MSEDLNTNAIAGIYGDVWILKNRHRQFQWFDILEEVRNHVRIGPLPNAARAHIQDDVLLIHTIEGSVILYDRSNQNGLAIDVPPIRRLYIQSRLPDDSTIAVDINNQAYNLKIFNQYRGRHIIPMGEVTEIAAGSIVDFLYLRPEGNIEVFSGVKMSESIEPENGPIVMLRDHIIVTKNGQLFHVGAGNYGGRYHLDYMRDIDLSDIVDIRYGNIGSYERILVTLNKGGDLSWYNNSGVENTKPELGVRVTRLISIFDHASLTIGVEDRDGNIYKLQSQSRPGGSVLTLQDLKLPVIVSRGVATGKSYTTKSARNRM